MNAMDNWLDSFRQFHNLVQDAPTDWQWIGPHMSQRMFGITEARAKDYEARFGGRAEKMEVPMR
jgi:hypothetical protein